MLTALAGRPRTRTRYLAGCSSFLRRNVLDAPAVRRDVLAAVTQRPALVRWGPLGDRKPWAPFRDGADRPWYEATPAIRTNVEQDGFHAIGAERAFVGTYARGRRRRRKIDVAAFAVRTQFKSHRIVPLAIWFDEAVRLAC